MKSHNTKSTGWRDVMAAQQASSTASAQTNSTAIDPAGSKSHHLHLELPALLLQLEQSLLAGQKALLARDLRGLEEQNALQESLRRAVSIYLHQPSVPWRAARPTALRTLHLSRVHLAMLQRAQGTLRIIAHLLAGSRGIYDASSGSLRFVPLAKTHSPEEEGQPICRV